jgi:Ca2+-binding EF-hand superfamily protein
MYKDTSTETTELKNNLTIGSHQKDKQSNLHFSKMEMIEELKKKLPGTYNQTDAEDLLVYGLGVSLLRAKDRKDEGVVYLTPNDENTIVFLDKKKRRSEKLINLSKLSDVSFGKSCGYFKTTSFTAIPDNCCLTLHLKKNGEYRDLVFASQSDLELFCIGVVVFLERSINDSKHLNTDLLTLKRIWKEYDPNHHKFLDYKEFSKFLANINFKWKKKTSEQIFNEIDYKKQGKITFKDFISFYEVVVTGEEFREVFQKYTSDPELKYIGIKGVMDFMEKEQHIKCSPQEIFQIMTKFSKRTKKLLKTQLANIDINQLIDDRAGEVESMLFVYENHSFGRTLTKDEGTDMKNSFALNFREFVNFLIDKNSNSIYNQDLFAIHQNMKLPLNDYYIYSSHNTYLKGSQIHGDSSLEMYNDCLRSGCRLVELDCWDGRVSPDPIITHWHFPVNYLDFKVVLGNIKEYAFRKSEYPVILSIENHCNDYSQHLMAAYFIEVLGIENIYVLDVDNPPLQYPSPHDLKRKFIIKCKRKRVFGNYDEHLGRKASSEGYNFSGDNNLVRHSTSHEHISADEHRKHFIRTQEVIEEEKSLNSFARNEEASVVEDYDIDVEEKVFVDPNVFSSRNFKNKNLVDNATYNNLRVDTANGYKLTIEIPKDEPIEEISRGANFKRDYFPQISPIGEFKREFPLISPKKNSMISSDVFKRGSLKNLTNTGNLNKNSVSEFDAYVNNYMEDQEVKFKNMKIELVDGHAEDLEFRKESFNKNKLNQGIDITVKPLNNLIHPMSTDVLKKVKCKYDVKPEEEIKGDKEIIARVQEIKVMDELNINKIKIKTVEALAKLAGMIGVKYKKEHFETSKYLPWECISIPEPDFVKYIATTEERIRFIKVCQNAFIKVYPSILRTDSTNHDPISCWAAGVQIAALNLQTTEDDWILINKIFFKINGGSKSGYILKPDILRSPFCDEAIRRMARLPSFKVKFKILSGFHMHLCIPQKVKISGIFVEATLKSPHINDEVKLTTNTISNNFLHPIWQSNSVQFEIYDPELSFIILKVWSNRKKYLLARSVIPVRIMRLGYRVLDLYDNNCSKFDESYLIVKSNKIFTN